MSTGSWIVLGCVMGVFMVAGLVAAIRREKCPSCGKYWTLKTTGLKGRDGLLDPLGDQLRCRACGHTLHRKEIDPLQPPG